MILLADSKDPDQTARMSHMPEDTFLHGATKMDVLTLPVPNIRRHLSSAFFKVNCHFEKKNTCICKVEKMNAKQHRSR